MKLAIESLEIALNTVETNEPIHRKAGNIEQADLGKKHAKHLRKAIKLLKAPKKKKKLEKESGKAVPSFFGRFPLGDIFGIFTPITPPQKTTTEVWVRLNEWKQVKVTLKLEELEGWGEITTRKVGLTEAELIAEKLVAKDYQTTPYFDQ